MRDIILIFILIILAATLPVILILGPQLDLSLLFPQAPPPPPEEPVNETPALPADAQRYFELKEASCDTLSKDFLIAIDDTAQGWMEGLLPLSEEESGVADRIVEGYSYNQTTKTYLRGDQMKRITLADGVQSTTIWKTGRVYECGENCTMRLMSAEESEEYHGMLEGFRERCAYFGKTTLPTGVDEGLLLDIQEAGIRDINGFRCEDFLISRNESYVVNATLDENQSALLWALDHLEGPLEECLDESTGIIVLRNMTLDLTEEYDFNFDDYGGMWVNQVTQLTFFTSTVPEEFLALPS